MLSRERGSPEKQSQNIWSISTQTFERNQPQQASQPSLTVTIPQVSPLRHVHAQIGTSTVTTSVSESVTNSAIVSSGGSGAVSFNVSREKEDGEKKRTTPVHMAGSPTATSPGHQQRSTKPNRIAPQPPGKMQTKSSYEQNGVTVSTTPNDAESRDPMPYVYPMHKLKPKLKTKEKDTTAQTGGNQSHEYAQPHAVLQEYNALKSSSVSSNNYSSIDPKLKQPTGEYQELLVSGMPRGQSLPTISTFATLS